MKLAVSALLATALLAATPALDAQTRTPPRSSGGATTPKAFDLLIDIAGEWQLRLEVLSELPLATTPGRMGPTTLGQTLFMEQWFRFTPRMTINKVFTVGMQLDVARGVLAGDGTRQVELARDPRATNPTGFPYGPVDLREAWIEWISPIGVFRVGQQSSHWGLGIVANDGNHRPAFGDYRYGDLVERVAFATRPGGKESDVVLALAGDVVYRDRLARLTETTVVTEPDAAPGNTRTLGGDLAFQGVMAVFLQPHACAADCDRQRAGVYTAYRNQRDRHGETLEVGVFDAAFQWSGHAPGAEAMLFAGGELALIVGHTTMTRDALHPNGHDIVQYGGALEAGLERGAFNKQGYYRIAFETGLASGDDKPWDGTQRRFSFSPDHRIGMVLFPELIAWETARSASIAADARLGQRPPEGVGLLPTNGAVANAAYLFHTAIVNPFDWLELRGGLLVAVSTSDVVDPTTSYLTGSLRNYRGGVSTFRDLGLELDGGVTFRIPLLAQSQFGGNGALRLAAPRGIVLEVGAQGGVLFPGRAFLDLAGQELGPRGAFQVRAGVGF